MNLSMRSFGYFLGALLWCAASPAVALTEVSGTTPGGAAYRIAVPDGWEPGDPLVLVQHAYSYSRVTDPALGALRDTQLAQGMAIAASGYRQGGWALFRALDDNAELLAVFTQRFGAPGGLFATGQQMGGLVALKLAEDPRFRAATRGVLAMCPIVGGVEHWDRAFDVRLIYDTACAGVAGGATLPIGEGPFPWATNLADIPAGLGAFDTESAELLKALAPVTVCTGLGQTDVAASALQRERLAQIKALTGIDSEPALISALAYAAFGLGDLLRAPDKLGGRNPFFNEVEGIEGLRSVRYEPSLFNDAIRRVRQDDLFARFDLERSSALDGSGTARIVDLHTSLDEVSDFYHGIFLRNVYSASSPSNRVEATIWESAASNCALSAAEIHGGWDALLNTSSVTGDVASLCGVRESMGQPGPCRFARPPAASVAFGNLRIREEYAAPTRRFGSSSLTSSGFWFDAARSGEGIVVEELGMPLGAARFLPASDRRVVVTWYTFAPPGDRDPGPRWLVGVGFQTGTGVHVPSMTMTRGARFGAAFDPADVQRSDWGSLSLVVDARQRMQVRYDGPAGWEGSTRAMTPLALVDFPEYPPPCCFGGPGGDPPPPDPPADNVSASGNYFNPARDGEGIQLHVLAGTDGTSKRAVLAFYTYDLDGNQLWLVGANDAAVPLAGGEVTFSVVRAEGAVFGDTFDPDAVQRIPWGTVTVVLEPATSPLGYPIFAATSLRWSSTETGYGSGGYTLTRITRPNVLRGSL